MKSRLGIFIIRKIGGGGKISHNSILYKRIPDCIFLHDCGKIDECKVENIMEVGTGKNNKGKEGSIYFS